MPDGRTEHHITPEEARTILADISDDDCRLLGLDPVLARPEWLMVSVLPVAPPHVRPAVQQGATDRPQHDDLTLLYADVLKANIGLKHCRSTGQSSAMIDE